jgi:acetylornithine/N-succinyldiaminopimelate aminotransferase
VLKKSFFCNSGTEALEGAIKFARFYGKDNKGDDAYQIITFSNSFHGRTFGALSATGQAKFHDPIKPMLPGFLYAEFNSIDSVKEIYNENVVAIILEPIQGEGGVIPADPTFIKELRSFCDSKGMLLIFDEVQCGTGRTGKFFAFENFDITPDMVCLAKGFGAGFPIGAVLANEKVAKSITYSSHGSTFGGNPLASAVALNVAKRVADKNFLNRVRELGEYLKAKLLNLKNEFSIIEEVRGMGLMQGIVLNEKRDETVIECFKKKLLLVGAGKDCIRFVPPLICNEEDIDNCIKTIKEVLAN